MKLKFRGYVTESKSKPLTLKPVIKKRYLGFAEYFFIVTLLIVLFSSALYYLTGMGNPPKVQLQLKAQRGEIILKVIKGHIPSKEWEYLVFNERSNPPVSWTPAPEDIETGKEIKLKSNLPRATYRVQIRHKPTGKFVMDGKVTVGS